MEKVKITQEQADRIESFKREFKGFSKSMLVEVLGGGYEVEPEFKVGDWVAYNYWGLVGKVVSTDGGIALDNRVNGKLNPNDFKRATPQEIATVKQRRWWAKHGRGVWEVRQGDVVHSNILGILEVTKTCGDDEEMMLANHKSLFSIDKEKDMIVCFAEDRKDI